MPANTRHSRADLVDAGWFSASTRIARSASRAAGTGTVFKETVHVVSELGELAMALLVTADNRVVASYRHLFSRRFVRRAVSLYNRGHRLKEPVKEDGDIEHTYILWPEVALEGIDAFSVWPLTTADRSVGELYVGVTDPAKGALPPDAFMETLSCSLALAVDRQLLQEQLLQERNAAMDDYGWRQNLLESIVSSSTDGVLVTDSEGRALLLNPAGEEILGVRARDIIGRHLSEVNPKLGAFDTPPGLNKATLGRITLVPSDGVSPKVAGTRISKLSYNGSEYIVWSLRDETQHQALEDRISEQSSRFSAFVDNSPLALFSCDLEGRITSKNSAVIRFLDAQPDELEEGQRIDDSSTLKRCGIAAKIRECLSGGEAIVSSHEIVHRSRGPIHLTSHFTPLVLEEGRLSGVQAIIEDTTDYIRTRSSLMRAEERYRVFFNNAPISLFEIDFSCLADSLFAPLSMRGPGRLGDPETMFSADVIFPSVEVVALNPAAMAMYGAQTYDELIGSWTSLLDPESAAAFCEMARTMRNGAQTYRFETTNQTLGGDRIEVSISAAVAPGHESDLSRVLLSILDITRIKAMEQTLQTQLVLARLISRISARFVSLEPDKTEEGIRQVIEEVGVALNLDRIIVFELNSQDKKIFASHVWHRIAPPPSLGEDYSFRSYDFPIFTARLRQLDIVQINGPSDLPEGSAERRFVEETGIVNLVLVPLNVPEEAKGVLSFASTTVSKNWSEEIISLLRILADVIANALDRRQREEAKQKSEDLLRTVFQSMSSGVMVTDPNGIVLLANPSAVTNFKLPHASALVGRPLGEAVKGAQHLLKDSLPGEQQQIVLTLADGTERTFGYTSASPKAKEQRILVFRDLTKIIDAGLRQKRAEEPARLGMMVAKLSHELKNPLTSILLGLRTLEDNAILTPDGSFILKSVLEEVRFLKSLLRRLLDANRFQDVVPAPGPIEPILQTVFEAESRLAAHKGVLLTMKKGPADTVLCIDPKAMISAVTNLVRNAVEACDRGNLVTVGWKHLRSDDVMTRFPGYGRGVVSIFIENNGPGIPHKVMDNLFVPFTTTKSRGTGLGLSIVRETVTGHGGVIEVVSPTDGHGGGTRFEILLAAGGDRLSCLAVHGGCGEGSLTCPVPEGCPVRASEAFHACWVIKGKASLLESGRWLDECTRCPAFQEGNLEYFHDETRRQAHGPGHNGD